MFLFMSNFRKDLAILIIITILLGTVLVLGGAYLTDNYFTSMVSGVIGDYGEYDVLFTLNQGKEEMALAQINSILENSLPGSTLTEGPRLAGSSNYLLKLPEEHRNKSVYSNFHSYFGDIPGIMSRNVISEPRLSLRGFRGEARSVIRPLLEEIEGVNFLYNSSDGFDIIVSKPEKLPEVRKEINELLAGYRLFEVRYPLDYQPEDLEEIKEALLAEIEDSFALNQVQEVTNGNLDSESISLLNSLKQMRTFLLSYATRVNINDREDSQEIPVGTKLLISGEEDIILEVVDNENNRISSLIQKGELNSGITPDIYLYVGDGQKGEFLGKGEIHNPRKELSETLDKLEEITPALNSFIDLSEELISYSENLNRDLENINQGLTGLEKTGEKLNKSLEEWQENEISRFLNELIGLLDELRENFGDIQYIQKQLVITSNRLKEAARLIEEKIVFVPRNNNLFQELNQLKEMFLDVSETLDDNYDIVAERLDNVDPLVASIDDWQEKIKSLLNIEETLSSGAAWQEVEEIIEDINNTAGIIDAGQLQFKLESIQDLLQELNKTQLPVVLEQLENIQQALPDLEEKEIIETINLIDSYIAGEVIPGQQIQILLEGDYNEQELQATAEQITQNPAVTYLDMDIGILQPNPRGEVFNVLRQVRTVISILIAFIFTLLILVLDQSLMVSIIRLNNGNGLIYGVFSGCIIFSSIYFLSGINFPYFNSYGVLLTGALLGFVVCIFSAMLNPVSREEWEAGKALGLTTGEIMNEIIIPAGKPGLLYLLNYRKMIFK